MAVVALIVTGVCFLTDPPSDDDSTIENIPFDYCEWTGEYNEETYIAAVNEYVQSGKKPVSYYNKSVPIYDHVTPALEKLSLTVSYPIKSCDNMWPALTSDTAKEEYQRRTFALIDTYVEGKTVYIDLGWLEKSSDYNPFTNFKEWSCVIVLTDMDDVKHYYYFRIDYYTWSFQPQPPLSFTTWDLTTTPEFTLPEFDDVRFVVEEPDAFVYQIKMIDRAGKETELISGKPPQQAVFADLNQDGYPEFLAQASMGTGYVHEFVVVYDIKNGEFYRLGERFSFDFRLSTQTDDLGIKIDDVRSTLGSAYSTTPILIRSGNGYTLVLYEHSTVFYRSYADGTQESLFPGVVGHYLFDTDDSWSSNSAITLYEDQTFRFRFYFSLISSSGGYGTYVIKDGRLILSTDDEKYTYVFEMHEDKLIYLGSEGTGYNDMREFNAGSEFIKQNTN